jgi:hypothetical protein
LLGVPLDDERLLVPVGVENGFFVSPNEDEEIAGPSSALAEFALEMTGFVGCVTLPFVCPLGPALIIRHVPSAVFIGSLYGRRMKRTPILGLHKSSSCVGK